MQLTIKDQKEDKLQVHLISMSETYKAKIATPVNSQLQIILIIHTKSKVK